MSEKPLLYAWGKKYSLTCSSSQYWMQMSKNCSAILAPSLWNLEKWLEVVVHTRNCWRQLIKPAAAVQTEYQHWTGLDWASLLAPSCRWIVPPAAISSGMSTPVAGTSGASIWGWPTSAFVGHPVAGEVNTKPLSGHKPTLKLKSVKMKGEKSHLLVLLF